MGELQSDLDKGAESSAICKKLEDRHLIRIMKRKEKRVDEPIKLLMITVAFAR
jgi:hypothetical protein